MARRSDPLHVVILAAGLGRRMKSSRIKLLHEVAGRPMIDYVLDAALGLEARNRIVIVGNQAEAVSERVPEGFRIVLQREQRGTGHAVLQTGKHLSRAGGEVLILNGDLPGIRTSSLRRFVSAHRRSKAAASVITTFLDDPSGYGRILRDGSGGFERIVEHSDASASQRRIREVNAGVYIFRTSLLFPRLRRLRPANRQREHYLPDVLEALCGRHTVRAVVHPESWEVLGVNSRADMATSARRLNARRVEELMTRGATLIAPETVWVGPGVRVGADTIIHPNVHLQGETVIGRGTEIHPGCVIRDCRIGSAATLLPYSVLSESVVGDGVRIGPFAHLRPGTVLDEDVRIGNFVELKKAHLGGGSKANHLTYLGDAEVGSGVNVGAGTITCNYDGVHKHRTVIENGVFIGSDTSLVAPVRVSKGAYVGAGSTITEDVPAGSLAIARGRQRNVDGWVERKKQERDGPKPAARPSRRRRRA